MSTCSECGKQFEDEHGHGHCFACKVRGVRFGSVPQGDSKFKRERDEVNDIQSKGYEPVRVGELKDKRDDKPKPFELPDKIKRQIHEQFHASGT